ncbi:hypothetical protein N7510_010483 [Penicillium lagena]|uniref:uncharacterized protein n=1 Tax=Penicillium lagena TaxID=94218 RepID=UPI00253FC4CE|nr:uncharacterized protein N7510_010483 [Penicillium lagena]KAJ5605329.1 hypothetical protein N7510_010483 [Penicillium lagena]
MLTALLIEATRLAGVRAVISQGWGQLGSEDIPIPSNVYIIGNCPHDWIFKKVSCVVHHGGAGTTAAAMAAGKPSVVVPFFGDQTFWGKMVAKAEIGPEPIPFRQLTAANLATAIRKALEPTIVERARVAGTQIDRENGIDAGVASFHDQLLQSRLNCSIANSQAAVWKIQKTDIRLSSGAAAILMDRDLLDLEKLELYIYLALSRLHCT